jgi:hypothetical protein
LLRRGVIAGLLLCAGCGVATRIDTIGPGFDGTRIVRMRGNVLPSPVGGVGPIELNAEWVERREQPSEFALLVEVHSDELRIRAGESLRLVLDGDTFGLRRDSATTSWPRLDPTVGEQARYVTTDSLLLRLAGAQDTRVTVRGAAWTEQRRLSQRNLEAIRSCIDEHVVLEAEPADSTAEGN